MLAALQGKYRRFLFCRSLLRLDSFFSVGALSATDIDSAAFGFIYKENQECVLLCVEWMRNRRWWRGGQWVSRDATN